MYNLHHSVQEREASYLTSMILDTSQREKERFPPARSIKAKNYLDGYFSSQEPGLAVIATLFSAVEGSRFGR